ncbi:nitrile hydratase, alpha subunit [Caldalkalibacillus thermarum TA2.A1]|uniref:Cobalt-containing nitrile hydratase subunit alpha n=1 Tax=Caldalkalibacillus thermarum (strain TA2.A1) TaxID=986075 RepID=NHAA_CALTT|nr:nitrile hydratase subunit alpha [Caldalkalibacillus thermarum]EGL84005.1 nitrile hydratase, alpha subunit [Caldalkalibacillus thermarum TA2.A1]QZT33070.1 nitrile hydratase subunit alpha [Caldalkalibacillus thermarum TA2.A1]
MKDNNKVHHHHPHPESFWSARAKALESLLIEKGILSSDAIDRVVQHYEHELGPMNGAKVVAKAWTDPAFKQRLLEDPETVLRELGYYGLQGEHIRVVENTDTVHNVVVCTLCSCYPWPLLGLPPAWYKEPTYRSRIVKEPRKVLREEFGLDLPDTVEIRVWDSSSEMRYMVLPQRPEGTEGMTEEELAKIVTRDSMIGVAKVQPSSVTVR